MSSSRQTALLKDQSDQGLSCLPLRLHLFEELLHGRTSQFYGDQVYFSH